MDHDDGAPIQEEAMWLREGLGRPASEQVSQGLSEVEQQIALEDLVMMMIDSAQDAARSFFDVLTQLQTDFGQRHSESPPASDRGEIE